MSKEQIFNNANQKWERLKHLKFNINMHQNKFQLVKKQHFQNSGSPDSFEKCWLYWHENEVATFPASTNIEIYMVWGKNQVAVAYAPKERIEN